MAIRDYTSRRMAIVQALVTKLKLINGNTPYRSNVYGNVLPKLLFWDEVEDFPAIHCSAGPETRQYQGSGYKDRFMTVSLRIYVQQEDAIMALEKLFEDIEFVIETNSGLSYKDQDGNTQSVQQLTMVSLDTDEGALEPLAIGEIVLEVRY
jgi:hypothetical protein